jgi:hypothetical protein
LHEALVLWRGPVLADLHRPALAEAEAARLNALRLVALESRIDADLMLGRHREVGAELGIVPGSALTELETAILRHDPALVAATAGRCAPRAQLAHRPPARGQHPGRWPARRGGATG